jgi:GMP synthase (glutamine-hydrolysing)
MQASASLRLEEHDAQLLRMKRVLLIDATEAPADTTAGPRGGVEQWFAWHLGAVEMQTVPASDPAVSAAAEAADGVIISGSPRDAWGDEPAVLNLLKFAEQILSSRQPVLGVCFGHQLLGRALGGDVRRNPAGWEVGATAVKLTPAGSRSPLFAGFPPEFSAIQSHRDAVLALSASATVLATNARAPIQAFSVDDRIFGVQFHPEMDGEILRHRWKERREKLRGQVGFDLDHALDSAEADASRVLHNFVSLLR